MRISLVLLLVCLACKGRTPSTQSPPTKPVATANATATPTATATGTGTGAGTGSCCCVSPDSKDGDVFVEDCAKQAGKCVTPWTKQCTDDFAMQQVAEQRNEADAACPSHDRRDCDGDGFRDFEDNNDNDPKVH